MMPTRGPVLSLVLPIFNEEPVIPQLHARLQEFLSRLGLDAEVVFVDDGSKDRSLAMLRAIAANEPRYRVLSFARNFGHQAAITAGIDHALGEAVVVMDADLQDPPEVVLEMVAKWREGFDVVYGRRRSREGETWLKLLTARWFYRVFAWMIPIEVPLDTGDFRLMSRRIVMVLRELRETHRFVRGLVAWLGFRQTAVLYDRPMRFAGETKYPLRKMLRFAIDGITSFSILPLRLATWLGLLISFFSVAVAVWALLARFVFQATVPGWTTVIVMVSLLAAVQLIMTGILGEYIGRIYEQVKARPLYVIAERINPAQQGANDLPEAARFPRVVSVPDPADADLRAKR
jgi:polyisoprenyl-phosphate glycosyltransferase